VRLLRHTGWREVSKWSRSFSRMARFVQFYVIGPHKLAASV
jgi:hypothetical protein